MSNSKLLARFKAQWHPPISKSPHIILLNYHTLMPFHCIMYACNGKILEIMTFLVFAPNDSILHHVGHQVQRYPPKTKIKHILLLICHSLMPFHGIMYA